MTRAAVEDYWRNKVGVNYTKLGKSVSRKLAARLRRSASQLAATDRQIDRQAVNGPPRAPRAAQLLRAVVGSSLVGG